MGHRILILATVVAVLPIASAANAQAQGRVVGRVIDQTGAVLPGVAIDLVVDKTEMTTTTDGNGHYLFEGVPAGTGELTFRLLDFGVLRRLISVTHGKTVTSDNVLNLALNADVIVTGSSTFRNIADVENPAENLVGIASSASEGAVTAEQLESRPLRRPGEVLETVPGMVISLTSAFSFLNSSAEFNTRRGRTSRTKAISLLLARPTSTTSIGSIVPLCPSARATTVGGDCSRLRLLESGTASCSPISKSSIG